MKTEEIILDFEDMNTYIKDATKEMYLKIRKECRNVGEMKIQIDIIQQNARYQYPCIADSVAANLRRMLNEEVNIIHLQ